MGGPRPKSNANLLASAAACTFKHLSSSLISCSNLYHLPLFFSLALALLAINTVSSAPALLNQLDYTNNQMITPAVKPLFHHQGVVERNLLGTSSISEGGGASGGRRFLNGPGSWPPRCLSKCGRCRPCKPVHVPVPPGTPVTAEYYPEAWRCKCGNKLYMP